jgi:hypothetical protein
MRDVSLFFQLPQDRADGRILEPALAGQSLTAYLRGAIGMRPDEVHDELLQLSGGLAAADVKHCSVNIYNIVTCGCQDCCICRDLGESATKLPRQNGGESGYDPLKVGKGRINLPIGVTRD